MQTIVISIAFFLVGVVIFMNVIEIAVRNGINRSVIGQFLEKENGIKENEKSFLDSDLDNDK
ncbi:hypothetical protein MHH33_03730 [Paenisporosarcina sp. FSL H8-0542]|uniref:hypothetical protein n=1 Tax=Paenisporosarcina sp. FSL H8-0542 TaxID=2921401 RepID=UPI00315A53D0